MKSLLFLAGLVPGFMVAETTNKITDAQADVLVAAEAATKEAARQKKEIAFTVLQRRTYDLGERTMTVERALPPNLPKRSDNPAKTPPTPAELQAFQEMAELAQQAKLISLRAVIYDNYGTPITHLRWQYEGKTYEAWSEADFNLFRTLHEFSLNKQQYRLSIFIFNESVEEMDKRRQAAIAEGIELKLPDIPILPTKEESMSEYFLVSDDMSILENEAAFTPIDDAHRYYDANLDTLKTQLANQEALNAARKRYLEAYPAPKDTTLTYWIEKK